MFVHTLTVWERMSCTLFRSLTQCILCLNNSLCNISEKSQCAVLCLCRAVQLKVSSYHFISRVTCSYSLPPVKITQSSLLQYYSLHFFASVYRFLKSSLLTLAFFITLPFPTLHEFPDCLHFSSTPSFFLQNQLDHSTLQFSLPVILSKCI